MQHTEAWHDDSQQRFAGACRSGWEGLIAKRADAPYVAGRSKDWLKLKCVWEQEFVIGGYTDPTGSRTDFGALLVGYYEQGALRTPGKSVPASRRRPLTIWVTDCKSWKRPTRPLWMPDRFRGAHTGPAHTRCADRLCRMDERRSAASAALSRAPRQQDPRGGRSGAAPRVTKKDGPQRAKTIEAYLLQIRLVAFLVVVR